MSINREEIAKGIYFTAISDKRYKMNRIAVNFLCDLNKSTVSENAVVPMILAKTNSKYPNIAKLNNKLSSLYAAYLSDTAGKLGDTQYMGISIAVLDDRYALENENLSEMSVEIITDCLLNPVLENGVFPQKAVELEKQSLIDNIEAELNEKRIYALSKSIEILFQNEPARLSEHGTVELAQKITAETAFKAYKDLLFTAPIEIICVGCNDFSDAKSSFVKAFASVRRGEIKNCSSVISSLKNEPTFFTEKLAVSQSKLVLGFKTDTKNIPALRVMTKIYGGTFSSKLFLNVREKLSLCYYCAARYNENKGALIVDSGVENQNMEKAKEEILFQLEEIKNGNITKEEIENAKLASENDYKSISDTPRGLYNWYFRMTYKNKLKSPLEIMEEDRAVTTDEIIEVAKSLYLDTVYVLTSADGGKADE